MNKTCRPAFVALMCVMMCALMSIPVPAAAEKPIETLIVTGQNNHNWQVSSVVIRQILENSGLFAVDVATSPDKGGDFPTATSISLRPGYKSTSPSPR